jgi:serine protease inhibitor
VKSVFANSLWLDKDVGAGEALVDTLVKSYHASVFEGDFGSTEYDFAVRSWINEHTGGLVDKLSDVKFDPAALVAFVSTVEFNARWSDEFDPALTMERTFHSPDGKIKCDFMYDERITGYYTGENFSAVKSYLLNSGAVTFILPDKDCSVETLLSDPEAIAFLFDNSKAEVHKNMKVKLSVPKFEIQSDMDLIQGLEDLGIDLESISCEDGGFISEIRHGAAVSIDEKGVKAAAVTISQMVESIPNGEVSFVLDRPFMFVITGEDGLPLFVGIVNHP